MSLMQAENVQKLFNFYLENALQVAQMSGVETQAEIKVRIIPNKDKNVDAKYVIVGAGKVLIPGAEEVVAHLSEGNPEDAAAEVAEEIADNVEAVEAEVVEVQE